MALDMAGRVDLHSPPAGDARFGALNAIAVFDGHQWASLCPELDIASVGSTSDEAIDSLIVAVMEAVAFAAEQNLAPGREVPPDQLRDFLVSSQVPYVARLFSA